MFDIGCGSSRVTDVPRLLLTHGHLDHSSGIPYYISQRNLRRLAAADIYVPPNIENTLRKILDLWSEIEDYEMKYNLHPIDYTKHYHLQGNFYFKGIPSFHRVPSNGYTVFEKTRKLKEEYHGLPGKEIAALKNKGAPLFYEAYLPRVTFSGDTKIEFVLEYETVRKSDVLFLECTYIDNARTVEQTRYWGHIHIDEIAAHADAFADTKHLFLIHFSPRYSSEKIRKILQASLPKQLY